MARAKIAPAEAVVRAAERLVTTYEKHCGGGVNFPAFWVHDEVGALRRALARLRRVSVGAARRSSSGER